VGGGVLKYCAAIKVLEGEVYSSTVLECLKGGWWRFLSTRREFESSTQQPGCGEDS
jgi:hypothetical protein